MKYSKLYYFVISCNFVNAGPKSLCISPNSHNTFRRYTFLNPDLVNFNKSFCYSVNSEKNTLKMVGTASSDTKYSFDAKAKYLGEPGTKSFRVEFVDLKNDKISPWHDLPLFASKDFVTMVVEIPRNTRAKMEIVTSAENNPIKQDLFSNGDLRDLDCPMYWNYGAIPRTWEAPMPYVHKYSGDKGEALTMELLGDNDPLDIVDVGRVTRKVGDLVAMKPVGAVSLIDQNEIDWKILGVAPDDEHFDDINELEDVDVYYPGTTTGIMEFFRWYKTPRGKPLNKFLPQKNFCTRKEALELVNETHHYYQQLMEGKLEGGDLWTGK
ncbi:inorganic pyrophosphatase [Theileria orientalis]|uniref:inorganic diphosphatase n=1 Tax=Theileria orientalis TaxID=68886 RepID=A0A976M9A9_THEOR|nr:inorganic pyrophosphatase [Theileria orientalis]